MFDPQADPSASDFDESVQIAPVLAQVCVPEWQGLLGEQLVPAEQATQVPVMQTLPVPQIVPSG